MATYNRELELLIYEIKEDNESETEFKDRIRKKMLYKLGDNFEGILKCEEM